MGKKYRHGSLQGVSLGDVKLRWALAGFVALMLLVHRQLSPGLALDHPPHAMLQGPDGCFPLALQKANTQPVRGGHDVLLLARYNVNGDAAPSSPSLAHLRWCKPPAAPRAP